MNIHDRFFKETFGDISVTKDFITNYLPETIQSTIDLETLTPQKDSYIDEQLKESFSDLLFQVNILNEEGYLYFLFEHKSTPTKDIPLQLLKYIVNIWEEKTKKQNKFKLPIVIPLVLYQGTRKWNAPKYLIEIIAGFPHFPSELIAYIPQFTYQFHDFSYRSTEEIKGQAILKIYRTLIKEISNPNNENILGSILKALSYLSEIENQRKGTEYLETMMRYVFSIDKNLTEKEVNVILTNISQTNPERSDVIMSLAELYKNKGKDEGRAEGIRNIVVQQLTKKLGILPQNITQDIQNLELPRLEKIAENIFDYETVQDLEKDLK